MNQFDYIVILGPTASGKTKLATSLADIMNAEIISADSRQIYRGMDIGTGKDLNEYKLPHNTIKHHLIDIKNAGDDYSVAAFQIDFENAFLDIKNRNKEVIVCGGTGLYINSILQQYEYTSIPVNLELRKGLENNTLHELRSYLAQIPSEFSNIADTSTIKRTIRAIEIAHYLQHFELPVVPRSKKKAKIFGIQLEGEQRRKRISLRLEKRIQEGLVDEVRNLLKNGVSAEKLIFYGLEYKLVTQHLLGLKTFKEMIEELHIGIHQYAKRQMTYFRKIEKDGYHIHWLDGTLELEEIKTCVSDEIFKQTQP